MVTGAPDREASSLLKRGDFASHRPFGRERVVIFMSSLDFSIFSHHPKKNSRASHGIERLEDREVPTVTPTFAITQNWGGGFEGAIKLTNDQSSAINNWRLEFDFAGTISSIWDASIVSRVGNRYTVTNAGWNGTLASNGQVSFGFVANPGGTVAPPTNFVLNGVPLGGGTSPASPSLSVGDVAVAEGNTGTTDAKFTIKLSAPATVPVTVRYATKANTAAVSADYNGISGQLTFNPGQTQQSVTVKVVGDTTYEPDETFQFVLSDAVNAQIATAVATATIRNDDAAPTSGVATVKVTNDWGNGYNADVTVRNTGSTAMTNWQVSFDYAGTISSIWNASIVSRAGNRYVVAGASWNSSIPAGGSVTFGYTASPGSAAGLPTNFVLSGGGGANRSPVAAADTAFVVLGQATPVAVLANDSDPDGDSLSIASYTQGQYGTVTLGANKVFSYTPSSSFVDRDSFQYVINDGRGGTATGTVMLIKQSVSATLWPASVYAPYVDVTLYPMFDMASVAKNQGIKYFNLAFVVADPAGKPAWGGYSVYGVDGGEFDQQLRAQIAAIRSVGGDVAASFGGASGQELALVTTGIEQLTSKYRAVVDAYGLRRIDFDIEGAAVADRASVDRRSQAIAALQRDLTAAGRPLEVWFTLPVLPTGLTADGVYLLQSAARYGVAVRGVNIMTMDYGDSAAPNPQGKMGDYAIQAGSSLFLQLQPIFGSSRNESQLWNMIGLTPMIGINDVQSEVFDQQEAREVLAFAQQKGIGMISMWSLNRDKLGQLGVVGPYGSGITQSLYEFSLLFAPFTR